MSNTHPKQRVLIVDDAPTNIKILSQTLKDKVKISFATNGPDALRMATSDTPPDMILLDVVMPEMDGYEVCRRLKANRLTRNIPVIFITSKIDEEDEIKGLEAGAVDYIAKPFSQAIVNARVHTHLELKRHRDVLENLSSLDGLTCIPNRRMFDESIDRQWRQAMRDNSPISLIMMDIDFFKRYNDEYGHQAGDECLKRVVSALQNTARRPFDLVARYGGEEFVCVLSKTDIEGATDLARMMQDEIKRLAIPHAQSTVDATVTMSFGIASIVPKIDTEAAILIEAADNQLYHAKNDGRNCIKFAPQAG